MLTVRIPIFEASSRKRGPHLSGVVLVALLIHAVPVVADFQVAVEHDRLVVIQGREAANRVTVTRLNDFDGEIRLSVVGAPPGMAVTPGDGGELKPALSRSVHVGDHTLPVPGIAVRRP